MERYGIAVDTERCSGCGACIEACPTGALYLVNGKAAVDNALCRGCEACLRVCPEGALALVARPEPAGGQPRQPTGPAAGEPSPPARQPLARRREPEALRIRSESAPVPWHQRVLPVVGAAFAWAGREIAPRVVDVVLDAFERRAGERQITARGRGSQASSQGKEGQGRRHRHRRRGGRS